MWKKYIGNNEFIELTKNQLVDNYVDSDYQLHVYQPHCVMK